MAGITTWLRERGLTTDDLIRWGARVQNDTLFVPVRGFEGSTLFELRRDFSGEGPRWETPPGVRKGYALYGLEASWRAIFFTKQAVVVEGVSDCWAMHRQGIANCVAALGSRITRQQWAILSTLCHSVIVLADGDDAGRRFASELTDGAAFPGSKVGAIVPGFDPAEYAGAGHSLPLLYESIETLSPDYAYMEFGPETSLIASVRRQEES